MLIPPQHSLSLELFLSEEPLPADCILVLGSSDPAESRLRAAKGAQLYAAGYAPAIALSGGDPSGAGISEADLMAGEICRLGIPCEALLIENKSNTTWENFALSREMLFQNGSLPALNTLIIVSTWWHLRRARALARKAFGLRVTIICCAADPLHDPLAWAMSAAGQRTLEFEMKLLLAIEK
jgi:uncharacterized SAM-binding protein YcdF (DUF218 family)